MNDEPIKPISRTARYRELNASKGLCTECPRKAKRKRNGKLARLCAMHLRRARKRKQKTAEVE